MEIKIAGIERHSSVNGPGVRYVLFTQGCPHHCPGCQNKDTWEIKGGVRYDTKDIINDILLTKYIDGVTLSGGDPLYQAKPILEIVKALKEHNINIWCYTGWTYEQIYSLQALSTAKDILSYVDVLVDGPFIQELYASDLLYKGSSNQRLIDCKSSREKGHVVLATSFDYGL